MGSKGSIETCADWTRETMIDFDRCLKVMKRTNTGRRQRSQSGD
jgi:hypothetical protein